MLSLVFFIFGTKGKSIFVSATFIRALRAYLREISSISEREKGYMSAWKGWTDGREDSLSLCSSSAVTCVRLLREAEAA